MRTAFSVRKNATISLSGCWGNTGKEVDENYDGQDGVVANEEVPSLPLLFWPNLVRDHLLVGFGALETGVLEIWTAAGRLLLSQRVEGRAYCSVLMGIFRERCACCGFGVMGGGG